MQNVHIVTDSCAHFTIPHFARHYPVTVLPNKISIGGRTYREGVDLEADAAIRLIAKQPYAPLVASPSEDEFAEVYLRLAQSGMAILSIHPTRTLYPSWENARAAAQQVMGRCPIVVLDSQSFSAGQGMLVQVAARATAEASTLDDIVREVRSAIERIYCIFYVETMDYLLQNKLMSDAHSILGTMLGIKPFLTLEEGVLKPMEKVRTRVQAIDKLAEFVVEFAQVDDAVILQNVSYTSEATRMLQDRLMVDFPGHHFSHMLYSPSTAALLGPDAMGVVVLESELNEADDDFA